MRYIASINTLFSLILSFLSQYAVHRSHLHTLRGNGGSFVQALLGRHNYGRLYLVSGVAVRQNSSQVHWPVTLAPMPKLHKHMLTLDHFLLNYFDLTFFFFLQTSDGMTQTASSTADIPLSALVSAPETVPEAAQILASESVAETASVSAPSAASEPVTAPDLTPVISQPVPDVTEAPVLAMDVLQGAGAELSLSELGLGGYTPVGLIQNLLEFMHVGIGLPWWGAIVAGKGLFFSNECCFATFLTEKY